MDTETLILILVFVLPVALIIIYTTLKFICGIPKYRNEMRESIRQYEQEKREYGKRLKEVQALESELHKKDEKIGEVEEYVKKVLLRVDKYVDNKCESYPYLAGLMSDFLTLHYEKSAHYLERKAHPAYFEAKRIRELRKETRTIVAESRILQYKIAYIEKLFPNITDIFDSGFSEDVFVLETEEDTDRTRMFLSDDEYNQLSTTDRNQLALDRYISSRKSKWQIGRDYEMYIGHCIEKLGFSVQYTGMIEKLEDMGRDLIATKERTTYIIQCKNWSQEKTIHEKHVFQLYGTMILYKIDHPNHLVHGTFVTTTQLSDKAKKVAKELGIEIYEQIVLKDFPRIKCNINRTTKEKIYHLPFDQQYDTAIIQPKDGEFYALTVKEAEEAGFRRAWKHFS